MDKIEDNGLVLDRLDQPYNLWMPFHLVSNEFYCTSFAVLKRFVVVSQLERGLQEKTHLLSYILLALKI